MSDIWWAVLLVSVALFSSWVGYYVGVRVGRRRETKEWFSELSIDKPSPEQQRWHQQALRAEGTRWRVIDKET